MINARNIWTVECDNGNAEWIGVYEFASRRLAVESVRRMRRAEGKRSRVVYRVAQFRRVGRGKR